MRGPEVWSRDLIASRLAWKPETPISVIELRVSTLPPADVSPIEATATEAQLNGIEELSNRNSGYELPPDLELYGGCKSWVELPFEIPAGAGAAALSDAEFAARGAALRAALAASGVDYAAVDVA